MIVQNMDIEMLIRKVQRAREEVVKSASSSHNGLKESDRKRFLSYIDDLKRLIIFFVDQPEMDLPEWTPTDITIVDLETMATPENEALLHLSQILAALEIEVANAQSARDGAGLISHDAARFTALLDKAQKFIEGYIAESLPIDYPESSPLRDNTGPGNKTVPVRK